MEPDILRIIVSFGRKALILEPKGSLILHIVEPEGDDDLTAVEERQIDVIGFIRNPDPDEAES